MGIHKSQLTALGKRLFEQAKADLEARKLWADVDSPLLEAYALELQTYFELAAEGAAVETGTGSVKSSPNFRRADSALKNSVQLAKLLGIGADSRKKLKAAGPKPGSGNSRFAALIRRAE